MPSIYRECAYCGIIIEKPWWFCQSCADELGIDGVDYANWAPWIKELANEEQRYERATGDTDLSLDWLVESGQDIDDTGKWVGGPAHILQDLDLLRYAPYASDVDNRAYWQANGIGER